MGLVGQEAAGAQAAVGVVGAAGGAVADLDLLAVAGKEHRVIAHDIAATDGGKADAAGLARAGVALAGENADFGQRLAQLPGDGLADGECCARGGIYLVAVVGLDDLDVGVGQHLRGQLDEPDGGIDARAHVGGLHDGDVLCGLLDAGALLGREAGGADDHLHAALPAGVQIDHAGFGAGEVDQHLTAGQGFVSAVGDGHAGLCPHEGAGIGAQRRAVAAVQRSRQFHVGGGQNGLDQHAPHAAGGASDGNLHEFTCLSVGW